MLCHTDTLVANLKAAGREAGHAVNDGNHALARRIENATFDESCEGWDIFWAAYRSARQEG